MAFLIAKCLGLGLHTYCVWVYVCVHVCVFVLLVQSVVPDLFTGTSFYLLLGSFSFFVIVHLWVCVYVSGCVLLRMWWNNLYTKSHCEDLPILWGQTASPHNVNSECIYKFESLTFRVKTWFKIRVRFRQVVVRESLHKMIVSLCNVPRSDVNTMCDVCWCLCVWHGKSFLSVRASRGQTTLGICLYSASHTVHNTRLGCSFIQPVGDFLRRNDPPWFRQFLASQPQSM